MGAFLPVSALPGLRKYKYAGEDRSLVSKFVLKPAYTRVVEWLPRWLAPNMVTLLGLVFSADSFLRALRYGIQAGDAPPRWVYFAHAVELFLYQTLDALDGQQARRTGTSSPLGELFDHCVDAINTSLQAYVCSSVFQLNLRQLLATEFLCTVNFFLSTWEEYHTHKLFLSVVSGPVEGILACCVLEILTGVVGPQVWFREIGGGVTLQDALVVVCAIGLLFNIGSAVANVRAAVPPGKFVAALRGLLPFAVMWAGFTAWLLVGYDRIAGDAFPMYFLAIAFTFALLVGRVITAHVTVQMYPMWTPLLALPFVGVVGHFVLRGSASREIQLVACLCGVAFGVYATFVVEIVGEITEYLDIGCLYIKHKTALSGRRA